jgi:hypothetical protein
VIICEWQRKWRGFPKVCWKVQKKWISDCGQLSVALKYSIAQGVGLRPVNAAAWLQAHSAHLGFVLEKVAVGPIFVQLLSFFLVSNIPLVLHIYSCVTDPIYTYIYGLRCEWRPSKYIPWTSMVTYCSAFAWPLVQWKPKKSMLFVFSTLSQKPQDFRKKCCRPYKVRFYFLYNFVWNISHARSVLERYYSLGIKSQHDALFSYFISLPRLNMFRAHL